MGICSHWYPKGASKPKVCQLEIIVLVNEEILGLQISMEDPMRMTVEQTGIQLVKKFLRPESID